MPVRKIFEHSLLPIIIGMFNIIFFKDPGFFSISYLPYLMIPLFSGLLAGRNYGYYSLLLEILFLAAPVPWLANLIHQEHFLLQNWYASLKTGYIIFLPLEILLIYIYSLGYTRAENTKKGIRKRLAELSRENIQLKKLSTAQAEVSRELEERVYRQKEAITSLYAQIQKMYTLDLNQALEVLLETIQIFTRASQLSIYEVSKNGDNLIHLKSLDETDAVIPEIPIEGSLEGWVHRNNRFFSIRMVLEYENLNRLDQGRSILIYPLHVNQNAWGILNVEAMPFVKYNEYTEQLLQIIIHLAETALSRTIDYHKLIGEETFNPETGLLVYSHFVQVFDEELIRVHLGKSTFSFIVLDILNLEDFREIKSIITRIVKVVMEITRGKGEVFHYKLQNQIGIILPSIDLDGTSLFCLDLLEGVNKITLLEEKTELNIEAVVGFAHSEKADTRETLMARAEKILNLQKDQTR